MERALGIVSFLLDESNGSGAIRANLDTVFPTQWTKHNIVQFSGDPD